MAFTSLTSCNDEQQLLSGQGTVFLTAKVNSDVKVVSRAATEDELNDKLIVWISNAKGAVRKYNGFNSIPANGISLLSDHYIVEGWTGDSISASWDSKYYKGREEFDVTNGESTQVSLTCKIANSVASVKYGDDVKTVLSDYSMTVGHDKGELTFEGDTDAKGYFMMPSTDKNLHWSLQGTLANGKAYTRTGVIENAKSATEYVINVNYTQTSDDAEYGGGHFTIEIEENPIVIEDEVYITSAPTIEGYDFDIDQNQYSESGKVGRKAIFTSASGTFTNFVVESSVLTGLIGSSSIDILNMTDSEATALENAGFTFSQKTYADEDYSWLKFNFEAELLNSLQNGTYAFTFTATDSYGKKATKTLTIIISDAVVITDAVDELKVWATHATVTGTILKEEQATNPGISYRAVGSQAWTPLTVSTSGTTITANITGLTPGTQYEVVATNGDNASTVISKFTTEKASQLPNASFEEGYTDGKIERFHAQGGSMFWDSGNTGSSTMSVNVTQRSTDKAHDGSYGLKLQSQFVGILSMGKFAAGNVFVGEYLATNGTNGVLGWGRTWTSRPSKLKGWLHYTPASVSYTSNDVPSVSSGDQDTGIIYIAILDDTMKSYVKSSTTWTYPVIVNTGTKEFFSQNDANVIAYGELVITAPTDGSDLVEFEIPLTYKRYDAKASNIMITCSASRYGDYFVGGSSVLYLDDFQLVYE